MSDAPKLSGTTPADNNQTSGTDKSKNSMAFIDPTLNRTKKAAPTSRWKKWQTKAIAVVKNPKLMLLIVGGGLAVLIILAAITYAIFANSLATPEAIINRKNSGLIFYDKSGTEFYRTAGARDTTILKLDKLSKYVSNATVAIEDKDFYNHGGFSLESIFRSIWYNIKVGDASAFGGSTITQQLVKNALLTQDKNLMRKYQELVLSIEIDRRYSKDQILELYLTSNYYGAGAYGVEEAAHTYFGKSAADLSIAEAAMIAGLPQAPSAYSPYDGSRELAGQRQRQVLRAMEAQGYITKAELDQAINQDLAYDFHVNQSSATEAPHFVEYVTNQLIDKYGEDKIYRSGFKIYTTLDADLQTKAQQVVAKQVTNLAWSGANNGALVAIDPTNGHVMTMVGSADYNNDDISGKFNVATAQTRQPGSATKPFAYLEAFNQDYTPATILHDKLTDFGGGYKPLDADRRFRGDVTARRALSNSLNIPAVETVQEIGVANFVNTMKLAGVKNINDDSVSKCGLAIVLGCAEVPLLDLTHAYSTLADQGQYHDLVSYTKIVDKNGTQVYPTKTLGLFDDATSTAKQIFDKGLVYLVTSILSDNNARSEIFGSNSPLKLSRPAAVKTGTTDDSKDAWTFGYTPQITVGVWVGNTASTPMSSAGATAAAPIWNQVMEYYLKGKPVQKFDQPSNVVQLPVCRGQEAIAEQTGQNTYMEYFLRSNQPKNQCNATPTPTPTPTESTPSATPTTKPTATPTPSITPTPTLLPTLMPTTTPTPTPTPSP